VRRLGLELAGVVVIGLLACGAVLLVRHIIGPVLPSPDVQHERAEADSILPRMRADSARAAEVRDSLTRYWQDSTAKVVKIEGRHVATANALRARLDSMLAAERDTTPVTPGQPMPIVIGPSLSCEERYSLRTAEASELRQALTACDARAVAESTRAELVTESAKAATGRLMAALVSSDSARKAEVIRPRPCRRSLLVVTVSCATAERLAFVVGLAGGFAATR
jgi:hypothetical protein